MIPREIKYNVHYEARSQENKNQCFGRNKNQQALGCIWIQKPHIRTQVGDFMRTESLCIFVL